MPSAHVYLCTEDIFQVVLFQLGNKKKIMVKVYTRRLFLDWLYFMVEKCFFLPISIFMFKHVFAFPN